MQTLHAQCHPYRSSLFFQFKLIFLERNRITVLVSFDSAMTLILSGKKKILFMFYSCITLHCISWWKSIFCSVYPFQFFSVPFSLWLSLNLQHFFPLLIFNLYSFPFFARVYMDHDIFPEWYCDFFQGWRFILILCSLQMSTVCSYFLCHILLWI